MTEREPKSEARLHQESSTKTILAFVAVVLAAMVGLGVVVYYVVQNRHVLHDVQVFRAERAKATTATDKKLCKKVDALDVALIKIVQGSNARRLKPGEYGYAYQQAHPREAANRLKGRSSLPGAVEALRAAACDPKNLPTAKHKP